MQPNARSSDFDSLRRTITQCRRCPRLVKWREEVAREKVRRFRDEKYWGRPVPGVGDPEARLVIVGLAPAAHGANRTGRMFTGDRSGDWLYGALHKHGFSNSAQSTSADDGLRLKDCYVTATVRCAPPQNKPLPDESRNCRDYLFEEFGLLSQARVVVGLGKIAFDSAHKLLSQKLSSDTRRPAFAHGAEIRMSESLVLIGSYHPSQQNTFTGKLTEKMFDNIFVRVKHYLKH